MKGKSHHQGESSEIYARYNVNVASEFHAQQGSEVHIFTQPVFSECSDYSGFDINRDFMTNKMLLSSENGESKNRDIELVFKKQNSVFTVQINPNPNDGVFSVYIINNSQQNIVNLSIKNVAGKVLYRTKCYCTQFNINQPLAAGLYFLEVVSGNEKIVNKVVIK